MKKKLGAAGSLILLAGSAAWHFLKPNGPTITGYSVTQMNSFGQTVTVKPCILPSTSCAGIFQNVPTTLTVNGTGFKPGSVIQLTNPSGTTLIENLPTTVVSSTQVVAKFTSPTVPDGVAVQYGVKVAVPQ